MTNRDVKPHNLRQRALEAERRILAIPEDQRTPEDREALAAARACLAGDPGAAESTVREMLTTDRRDRRVGSMRSIALGIND